MRLLRKIKSFFLSLASNSSQIDEYVFDSPIVFVDPSKAPEVRGIWHAHHPISGAQVSVTVVRKNKKAGRRRMLELLGRLKDERTDPHLLCSFAGDFGFDFREKSEEADENVIVEAGVYDHDFDSECDEEGEEDEEDEEEDDDDDDNDDDDDDFVDDNDCSSITHNDIPQVTHPSVAFVGNEDHHLEKGTLTSTEYMEISHRRSRHLLHYQRHGKNERHGRKSSSISSSGCSTHGSSNITQERRRIRRSKRRNRSFSISPSESSFRTLRQITDGGDGGRSSISSSADTLMSQSTQHSFFSSMTCSTATTCVSDTFFLCHACGTEAAAAAVPPASCFSRGHNHHYCQIKTEVEILKALRHPNIVALDSVLETRNKFFLVTEPLTGHDLHDFLVFRGARVTAGETVWIMRELAAGLSYLHDKNIVYRALSAQNVQFLKRPSQQHDSDRKCWNLVLTNFGRAEKLSYSRQLLQTTASTFEPYCYTAPEALMVCDACVALHALRRVPLGSNQDPPTCNHNHNHSRSHHRSRNRNNNYLHHHHPALLRLAGNGKAADIWSLGVVLYTLLCGGVPSRSETFGGFLQEVCRPDFGYFDAPTDHVMWRGVSPEARNLVRQMLDINASARPSIDGVLGHEWLRDGDEECPSGL